MPHYADGTLAKVGDVVKGKGYNLKGPDGQPREFVGTVVGIVPASDSCNIRVAAQTIVDVPAELYVQCCRLGIAPPNGVFYQHEYGQPAIAVQLVIEYGQCDHFVKVA